jgi:hypothetical protein
MGYAVMATGTVMGGTVYNDFWLIEYEFFIHFRHLFTLQTFEDRFLEFIRGGEVSGVDWEEVRIADRADGEADVVYHLTEIVFDGQEAFALLCQRFEFCVGEWIECYGPEQSDFFAFLAEFADSGFGNASDGAVSTDDEVCIFCFKLFALG